MRVLRATGINPRGFFLSFFRNKTGNVAKDIKELSISIDVLREPEGFTFALPESERNEVSTRRSLGLKTNRHLFYVLVSYVFLAACPRVLPQGRLRPGLFVCGWREICPLLAIALCHGVRTRTADAVLPSRRCRTAVRP